MKQSVYARNYESLMGTAVARRPGMHSHGGPWEREDVDVWVLALGCTSQVQMDSLRKIIATNVIAIPSTLTGCRLSPNIILPIMDVAIMPSAPHSA